jgi:SAM-dependent methyltransferase
MYCPVCAGAAYNAGARGEYTLARCERCRHLFVVNLPDQETVCAAYESSERFEAIPDFIHGRLNELARQCEPFARFRRMLDVGFGAGAGLKAFADAGWEAHGVEISRAAAEQAHARGMKLAIEADFLHAPYDAGFFDLIVMSELIEHLTAPIPFLEQAARLLRRGGVLYLTTPNAAGVSGRVLGMRWSVVAPPQHLNLFSPQSLRIALKRAGFRQSRVQAHGVHPAELVQYMLERAHLRGRLTEPIDRVGTSYAINRTLITTRSGRVTKRAVNGLLSATRLGDALKAFAQNPP